MFYLSPLGTPIVSLSDMAWIALFLLIYAALCVLLFAFFLQRMSMTKKAREREAKAIPEEARKRIGELAEKILLAQEREVFLSQRLADATRLLKNECNFGRNHRAEVQAFLQEIET
jgi:Flp pilus assembly protein TadB